jgi:uncharacterized membrane protein YjjP (DUF1212 family)
MPTEADGARELQRFVVQLGAAMNASGQPAHAVQERLTAVARAYGAHSVTVSAFPTYLLVTMGRDEPATLELTSALAGSPRLDQIAALDRLLHEAEHGAVPPADGLRRLDEIGEMHPRFQEPLRVIGYAVLSVGVCLILRPAPREVPAAALFGALVGFLRSIGKRQPTLQVLMPVIAAFAVSSLGALALKHDLTDPGLRAVVASLVVFLPGAALTTAVLELAAGQMISGSSRLVSGGVQLALLAFGILAGIQAVGIPSAQVLSGSHKLLGAWSPWLGVLVFAGGVVVAYSASARSFPSLLVVLYAAWSAQVLANVILGGYISALIGATVMTLVAVLVSRWPSAMPAHASFLPGFWLLVPGALGLIGVTELAGGGGGEDIVVTVGSIFAVALGVLCGTQLLAWAVATGRVVDSLSGSLAVRSPRVRHRSRYGHRTPRDDDK